MKFKQSKKDKPGMQVADVNINELWDFGFKQDGCKVVNFKMFVVQTNKNIFTIFKASIFA